ncbi:MAG: class I SAM-dependent methyltransferase [Kiloniellales bacterium]|nr:class I SAM-dependent methyltransferase [Kiloniellales bacterium]
MLTVLNLARRGFFIPYRYAERLPRPGARNPYPAAEARLAGAKSRFRALLEDMNRYRTALHAIGDAPPPAPRWAQDWFPRLDAAAAYTLVRQERPRRIVEIGSGHSTRFLARAAADEGLACRITAIDPAPRADLSRLELELIRAAIPGVGEEPFQALEAGDFLMIDSSHILMPGSDADYLYGRVLPALPPGVLVHVHDVFLPDDYPAEWDWRGYNEQLAVLQLILGSDWDLLFASHYVATRMASEVAGSAAGGLPLGADAYESSLWLRKAATGAPRHFEPSGPMVDSRRPHEDISGN